MTDETFCNHRGTSSRLPGWAVAVIVFASGIVIGQTLSQIAAKLGIF